MMTSGAMNPADIESIHSRSSRSIPTGPGSRGGRWHEAEFRRAYHRAWRAAHPEYRERESLRGTRRRGTEDRIARLPVPAEFCACDCGCREAVVSHCGFCRDGMH